MQKAKSTHQLADDITCLRLQQPVVGSLIEVVTEIICLAKFHHDAQPALLVLKVINQAYYVRVMG